MELCIDIGNTTIEFGFYKDDRLFSKNHLKTDLGIEETDFISYMINFCHQNKIVFDDINDIVYSSVVPEIDDFIYPTLKKIFPFAKVLLVKRNLKYSFDIDVDKDEEIGSDLLAGLEGAAYKYKDSCVICDLGTATKLLLLDKKASFFSCLILTGMDASVEFLSSKASKLPLFELGNPKPILESNNTIDAMKSGIVYGHADMIMGLTKRYDRELGYQTKHIITGGQAHLIGTYLDDSFIIDYDLVLDGLHHLLVNNIGE